MICWVITGAGHFLNEVCDIVASVPRADVFFTRAGFEVASKYRAIERLASAGTVFHREDDAASYPIVKLWSERYAALVIAPATSNTVAKCAHGIADSIASTFFSQAGKAGVPIFILPTDAGAESSLTASGRAISIKPRKIDIANIETIATFDGVHVARTPGDLADRLRARGLEV